MSRPVSHAPLNLKLISVLGLTFCICLGFWGIHTGVLTSQQQFEKVIAEAGPVGPALFTAFQAVQVVLPILPGGIGCLVGVILFATIKFIFCLSLKKMLFKSVGYHNSIKSRRCCYE